MPPWDTGTNVAAQGRQYQTVAANAAAVRLGLASAAGDTIDQLWLFPVTTTPGLVNLFDGNVLLWSQAGGIVLANLAPIFVPLNLKAVTLGATQGWRLTLGANISALASGVFTTS